jgi:hypothetical protein
MLHTWNKKEGLKNVHKTERFSGSGQSGIIDRKPMANRFAVRDRVNETTWLAEGVGGLLRSTRCKGWQKREYCDAPQPTVRVTLAPLVELQRDILYVKDRNQLAKFCESAELQSSSSQDKGVE